MQWVRSQVLTWMVLISVTAGLSGCASGAAAQPSAYVYPEKGQTATKQAQDTADCQSWAKHQTGFDPVTDSAKGAGVGALVGALGVPPPARRSAPQRVTRGRARRLVRPRAGSAAQALVGPTTTASPRMATIGPLRRA